MSTIRLPTAFLSAYVLASHAQNINLTFSADNSCYEDRNTAFSNISISIGGYPRSTFGVCFNLNETFIQPAERINYNEQFRCRFGSLDYDIEYRDPENTTAVIGSDGCIGDWGNATLEFDPTYGAGIHNYSVTAWENFDPQANYSQVTVSQYGRSENKAMFIVETSSSRNCGVLDATRFDCGTEMMGDAGFVQGDFCAVQGEVQTRPTGIQSFRILESSDYGWDVAPEGSGCVMGETKRTLTNASSQTRVSVTAMLLVGAAVVVLA